MSEVSACLVLMMLPASDRCDNCGAQAYVVTTVNGTDLLWCGHHWRRFEAGLVAVASKVRDYTFVLEGS